MGEENEITPSNSAKEGDNSHVTSEATSVNEDQSSSPLPNTRFGKYISLAALLVAIASAGGSLFVWYMEVSKNQEITRLSNKIKKMESGQSDMVILSKKILSDTMLMRNDIDALKINYESGIDNWILNEVAYLLRVANQSLYFNKDIDMAIAALTQADKQMEQQNNPLFFEVRRILSKEMAALASIVKPDIEGLAFRLEYVQEQVASLPLHRTTIPGHDEDVPVESQQDISRGFSWKTFFDDLLISLKGLITVRYQDDNEVVLIPAENSVYLKLNLQLKLESSRLALYQRDDKTFHEMMKTVQKWVKRYFDQDDAKVKEILDELVSINSTEISPELPDISGSLAILNRDKLRHKSDSKQKLNQNESSGTGRSEKAQTKIGFTRKNSSEKSIMSNSEESPTSSNESVVDESGTKGDIVHEVTVDKTKSL